MKKIIEMLIPIISFVVMLAVFSVGLAGILTSQGTIDENHTPITVTATIVDKNISSKVNVGTYIFFKVPSSREVYYIELEIENKYRDIVEVEKEEYLQYSVGDTVTLYQSGINKNVFKSEDKKLSVNISNYEEITTRNEPLIE